MSSINDDIIVIEVSAELLKKQIKNYDALKRLRNNKDFQAVIEEGYFKDLASNTVLLKADKNLQGKEQQKDLDNQLMGISALNEYFNAMRAKAKRAEMDLEADAITREELLAEAL